MLGILRQASGTWMKSNGHGSDFRETEHLYTTLLTNGDNVKNVRQ